MILITIDKLKEIAGQIDMGLTCFIHKQSGEVVSFAGEDELDLALDEDNPWAEEIEKVEKDADNYVQIEKMDTHESFSLMEDFIGIVNSLGLKGKLYNALSGKKPFRHFKAIIDDSEYRQDWFDFKDQKMLDHVKEQIDAIDRNK